MIAWKFTKVEDQQLTNLRIGEYTPEDYNASIISKGGLLRFWPVPEIARRTGAGFFLPACSAMGGVDSVLDRCLNKTEVCALAAYSASSKASRKRPMGGLEEEPMLIRSVPSSGERWNGPADLMRTATGTDTEKSTLVDRQRGGTIYDRMHAANRQQDGPDPDSAGRRGGKGMKVGLITRSSRRSISTHPGLLPPARGVRHSAACRSFM